MERDDDRRPCKLQAAVGMHETCPGAACPFWEPGGAALDGRCAFGRLEVADDASLAVWLLELRDRLATTESTAAAEAAHSRFSHLLNESAE